MNVESWLNEIDDVDKFVDDLIEVNNKALNTYCPTVKSWNLENYNSHIDFLNNLERVNDYCKQNNMTIEQYLQGEWMYKQEMDNMKFCSCGCIIANNEYKCDYCKEGW